MVVLLGIGVDSLCETFLSSLTIGEYVGGLEWQGCSKSVRVQGPQT